MNQRPHQAIHNHPIRYCRGLTLIELMIALAITAIIATTAYQILTLSQQSSDSNYRDSERLLELDRGFGLIQRDIQQLLPRPVRTPLQEIKPAFMSLNSRVIGFEFSRSNWSNPLEQHRAEVQRLQYFLYQDALYRRALPQLDLAEQSPAEATLLISGIKQLHLRYLHAQTGSTNSQWIDHWPPEPGEDQQLELLPAAIELEINSDDLGTIQRLFLSPGAAL